MDSKADLPTNLHIPNEEPYTFLLGMKEMSLMSIILFFGFTGFTFCVDKIYSAPLEVNESQDIYIHKAQEPEAYISYVE